MDDGHTPGDLRWPPPTDDLEPFELLEIVRDETGRDRWRRDHRAPEVPEAYREWLPKRLGRAPTAEPDALDMFPAAAPESEPEPEPQPATEIIATVPLFVAAATETVTTAPAAVVPQAWPPPATPVDASVPALRLSLVPAPPAPRPAPSSAHRTFAATAERLSLFAAGALFGVVVAVAGLRESTSDRADDETGKVPVAQETTLRPHAAAVPAATITRQGNAPVAPAASVTLAAPPAQVVPLAVAAPTPARVQPPQVPTRPTARPTARPAAAGLPANAERPARQTPVTPTAARLGRAPRPTVSEGPAVLGTVDQYATAWSRLDARATQALWPSVDREALVGTFTAIREQRLTLAACKATVVADRAAVTCRGTLRYRPRVGEHSTRTEQGRWTFDLARHGQAWVIANVGRP